MSESSVRKSNSLVGSVFGQYFKQARQHRSAKDSSFSINACIAYTSCTWKYRKYCD
jgi:hypothetical protein